MDGIVTTTSLPADSQEVVVGETAADFTYGSWMTEESSAAAFDWEVEQSGLFKVWKERWGQPMALRLGQEMKRMRIDRILIPTRRLIDAGWSIGPFGVELKKSSMKLGPIIAQATDYKTCAWELEDGFWTVLDFIAIWPVHKQHATTASIMAQQRIGGIYQTKYYSLMIVCGEINLLSLHRDGDLQVHCKSFGRKAGSR